MIGKLDGVDPQLRSVARFLPAGLALYRGPTAPRVAGKIIAAIGKQPDVEVAQVNSHVVVRIHRPEQESGPGPVLLWMHGGGMFMGSAVQDDKFSRKLVNFCDIAVVSVEYRLCPEHPFPVPIEDCYAALTWLARQPWVDPNRIAVGGASAGGLLTAALANLTCDRGEVELALQMMVYPALDHRVGTQPDTRKRVLWTGQDNQLMWKWYIGDADPVRVSPSRREDFAGLAPAWIGVGTLDLFYEECVEYSRRLREAGVACHEEFAAGAYHGFDLISPNSSVSQRFFASQVRALRGALVDTAAHVPAVS